MNSVKPTVPPPSPPALDAFQVRPDEGDARAVPLSAPAPKHSQATSLHVGTYSWLAASLGGENPQPIFRDRNPDMPVAAHASLPAELARTLGKGCGRRVLPYRLQDRYDRERQLRVFRAIFLENEHLKATFLPELGGRLISLFHKPTQRELLFNNPVFQPANLALRDAWFAGGIEWNIGQFGHAFHTCAPVFAAAIPGLAGETGLRLYDFERCKGLLWQLDFYLPPGAKFLYAFTRVVNPRPEEVAMYWWTNVAIPETPKVRVLAPADQSVYVQYGSEGSGTRYGLAQLPRLPSLGGKDGTYPRNSHFANEFFCQCPDASMPWQAALDEHGAGFIEASTQPLTVRKLFCWGTHRGGQRWKEFLSVPGREYVELQAGLGPTQQHTVPMPANSQWTWLQAFGAIQADPAKVHGEEWPTAWRSVDAALQHELVPASLARLHRDCAAKADHASAQLVSLGAGWGALEARRRAVQQEAAFPAAFVFPEATLQPEQARWLALLADGRLPEQADPAQPPGEWMIQPEWHALLEQSLQQPANRHWFALLHLGVMRAEAFDEAGAAAAWEASLRHLPSPWAWRNLAALALRRGQPLEAQAGYSHAWQLAAASGTPDISFALERLVALLDAHQMDAAWDFYQQLPAAFRAVGSLRVLAARAALARSDLDFVEAALAGEIASLREGARDLTDLWFGLQARRRAASAGRTLPAALMEVKSALQPPAAIDFRVAE
jgi:hypothetical protein